MVRSAVTQGNRGVRRHLSFFLENLFPWLMRGDHELMTMHIASAVNFRKRFAQFKVLSFDPVSYLLPLSSAILTLCVERSRMY
jgi:hypothetical protein